MQKFSRIKEKAIESKIKLFSPIFEKGLTFEEQRNRIKSVEKTITAKRMEWFDENKDKLDFYLKLKDATDLQKALALLFGYMHVNPKDISVIPIYIEEQALFTVNIYSRNFCPYLDAFKRMDINPVSSAKLCELALESPCQALIDKVNPNIRFHRNYRSVRPISECCSEGLVIRDLELSEFRKLRKASRQGSIIPFDEINSNVVGFWL
jgi:hypothetical protein